MTGTTEDVRRADAISDREQLATRIERGLGRDGYYFANLSEPDGQQLIDLQWAAMTAGRKLGRRTTTFASELGKRHPGAITVVVSFTAPATPTPGLLAWARYDDQPLSA